MKKHFLCWLLILTLLCGLLPTASPGARAYSETDIAYPVEGGNIYFDKATGTITDADSSITSAVIPDMIDGVRVTTIGSMTNFPIPDQDRLYNHDGFAFCHKLDSITLPDSLAKIGSYSFYECARLTSITITKGVTEIGYNAFEECKNLRYFNVHEANEFFSSDGNGVLFNKDKSHLILCPTNYAGTYTIPDSVKIIDPHAFSTCTNLTAVTVPENVTKIGDYAFEGCTGLTSITLPDSVVSIGCSAFTYCTGLEDVTLSANLEAISKEAFSWCTNLTSIAIPDSVTSIGHSAFYHCDNLSDITIGDNVTDIASAVFSSTAFYNDESNWTDHVLYIGKYLINSVGIEGIYEIAEGTKVIAESAFYSSDNLTKLVIPSSVTHIGKDALHGCDNLLSIEVSEDNGTFASDSFGILFNKDMTVLLKCPGGFSGSYTTPSTVVEIYDKAFSLCYLLESVVLSDSVRYIGEYAFSGSDNLTHVEFGSSVTIIGDFAFYWCEELTTVELSDSVRIIGDGAFWHCCELTSVTIANDARSMRDAIDVTLTDTGIGTYAFYCCYALATLEIPLSVRWIRKDAFYGCSSLEKITLPDTLRSIGTNVFNGTAYYKNEDNWIDDVLYIDNHLIKARDTSIMSYEVREGTLTIADAAFKDCSALKSINFPESMRDIGTSAFENCSAISEVNLPASVRSIGTSAFENCSALKNISLAETVMSIGNVAFSGTAYYNNKENWDHDVLYIGAHLIAAERNIETVSVREGTLTIAACSFIGCYKLSDITLPDSLRYICSSAFSSTAYYKNDENWSDNILLIGKHLISAKKSIEGNCIIPTGTVSIAAEAFYECEKLTSINMPSSIKCIADWAFFKCDKLSDVNYAGTTESWIDIDIGDENAWLLEAAVHFESYDENASEPSEDPTESTKPTEKPEDPTEPSEPEEPTEKPTEKPTEEPNEPTEPSEPTEEPSEPEIPTENPFKDVKKDDYFATPVLWAVGKGITNGMSATSFAPNANCTRGQIVTFLWRACGSPEPTNTTNPFKDVNSSEYYYKAVLWAVEQGITTGLSKTSFGPNATCTRGQVATFLWRSQGEPAPKSTNNPFSDVKTGDYYRDAVLWAVENNVTQGMGGGKFAPNASCTRGQIVTFLFRAIA